MRMDERREVGEGGGEGGLLGRSGWRNCKRVEENGYRVSFLSFVYWC